jgi:hypothetical protein
MPVAAIAAGPVDFARQIRPILNRCAGCHGVQVQMSGLRLDRGEHALRGGYSGPAIRPGDSAGSKLIQMVSGAGKVVMPPDGPKLSADEIELLRNWIDQGAKWPVETAEPRETRRKSDHWSFQPVRRPDPPAVRNTAWVRNPIDRFIAAVLEREKIAPSPEADKATLLRRLHLDLTGLPPAPGELAGFLADRRANAYEAAVDRLLASPHYGEKWARHWLDLARYADSDGYESDLFRPHAWRYRHWVIDALNRDMPFDQFTIEQIAGDLLPGASTDQMVATGFHRNTLTNREGGVDTEEFRVEQVLDRTNTVGVVWLGLTVGCAQCHDHKYDPISQKDYYALAAFFNTAIEQDIEAPLPGELGPYLRARPQYEAKRKAIIQEYGLDVLQREWEGKLLEAASNRGRDPGWDTAWKFLGNNSNGGQAIVRLSPERRSLKQREQLMGWFLRFGITRMNLPKEKLEQVRSKWKELESTAPSISHAQAIREAFDPPKTHILMRGDFRQPGIEVEPGTPGVLAAFPMDEPRSRLGLARWLVSRKHTLTARIAVNRMWQEFFGRGVVRTSEDFGKQGEKPSHPELLDWLASEFMDRGWSMKQMQRLIVTSATYRQASDARADLQDRDAENSLLARQSRLRLPAELIRDAALAASGLLDPRIGGKSVRPPQPKGVAELGYADGFKWEESSGPDRYRRGLYIHFQRSVPYPQLMTFDAPNGVLSCSRRERSNTPLQALNLLNDPVFFEAAQALALRVLRESGGTSFRSRLNYLFRLCLGRDANQLEADSMSAYFERQQTLLNQRPEEAAAFFSHELDGIPSSEAATWVAASRAVLNLDEFLNRE